MIRAVWVLLAALVATPFYGAIVILWRWLRLPGLPWICATCPRDWARILCWAAGARVELEGVERLGGRDGEILVANHESWFDVLAISGYLPADYRFVAKKELARVPFFGGAWQACGHVGIDRTNRAAAIEALGEARRQVSQEGRSPTVVIFPEGTRSPDGRLHAFKKGAFVLAIQAGVPVVPAAIIGSRAVMPKAARRIRPGTIRIRIGEPIPVEGLTHEDRNDLAAAAREAVAALRGGEGVIDPGRDGPVPSMDGPARR